MELFTYKYSITDDFPNQKVAPDRLGQEIQDSTVVIALSHITVEDDDCNIVFKAQLSNDDISTLDTIVANHSGEILPQATQAVQIESYKEGLTQDVHLHDEMRDGGGKLRVHQTSRKDGLAIHWTSTGDDLSNPNNFGTGQALSHRHMVGDSTSQVSYIDFNGLLNESWIHEVVLTWASCDLDVVTVDIVPDICMIADSTAGNFDKYGPIVIPAMPGQGCCNIVSDVYAYRGGLVAQDSPSDPSITPGPAFWNADFNETTGRFENLTPAPAGDGGYNIFHEERALNRLFNRIRLLQSGFQIFNSSDTDQLTHGLRIRCTYDTVMPDHEWTISAVLVMHRQNVNVQANDCV